MILSLVREGRLVPYSAELEELADAEAGNEVTAMPSEPGERATIRAVTARPAIGTGVPVMRRTEPSVYPVWQGRSRSASSALLSAGVSQPASDSMASRSAAVTKDSRVDVDDQ